jgi:hypothetical protein
MKNCSPMGKLIESALNQAVRKASPRAPVALHRLFEVDQESADDEFGHGVQWGK